MKKNPRTILYLILIALCITGAITGSFFDLQISEKLYIGDSLPAKLISLFTVFVFCGSCFFFLGVLFRQLWERYLKVTRRVITAAIFTYLFCSTAALCGAKILNDPIFAGKLTEIQGTLWGSLITGSIIYIAFFMLGIIINGKKADPDKIKTLIKLILIFTIGFFIAHYLNCMIERPSYSLLISEGNPDGFMKWYQIPKGSKLLMSLNDLISSPQGSFVSSHVLYAVLFIVIFPAYSLAIPSLKKYEKHLMVIAGILSVSVIICRMITGNNYLTDISFAAFYSLKFCMSYEGFRKPKRRISKSIFKKFRD